MGRGFFFAFYLGQFGGGQGGVGRHDQLRRSNFDAGGRVFVAKALIVRVVVRPRGRALLGGARTKKGFVSETARAQRKKEARHNKLFR
jgi:hypothetical protein